MLIRLIDLVAIVALKYTIQNTLDNLLDLISFKDKALTFYEPSPDILFHVP